MQQKCDVFLQFCPFHLKQQKIELDEIMVSFDVTSLYTTIAIDQALFIIRDLLEHDEKLADRTLLSPKQILDLLDNKLQFTDDTGQWAVSKNIDLAAEYLQRDLDKLSRWCAKWRIKLNPEKTKVIIFFKSRSAIRAAPTLSLYGALLLYYPHIKFLGITFDNRMTFTKHFEESLDCCNNKFHRLRILVNKKWGPSPAINHFTNLQTMCKTNIRIWDCFYRNCFGIRHQQNSKSPELFH